ncbi:MAG TPA: TetR/AcrR family transcriptional regulator, partial [Mycobacterium sp.]|nr:TetR/AcrR family transcriptional regulator [Mycobacterium sp.]
VNLFEESIQRMKDNKLLTPDADPRQLAMVVVSAHQGGGTLAFAYQQDWPHADAIRFAVNYLRGFAADPAERVPRTPRRMRRRS